MRQSDDLDQLFAALSQAQGEIENPTKDAENPGFKRGNEVSRYADLASVRNALRVPFAKHGLSYLQMIRTSGRKVSIETILAHKSGQFIAETADWTARDETPQAMASASTYGRRYGLMSISGIAPDDDDGNAASGVSVDAKAHGEKTAHSRSEADQSAAYYITRAKVAFANIDTTDELKKWWKDEQSNMAPLFNGKDDPNYVKLVNAYKARGAELSEPAPATVARTNGEKLTEDRIPY